MSGTVERFKIRMVGITSKKRDGMSPHKEALGAHQFIDRAMFTRKTSPKRNGYETRFVYLSELP